jgi:integrase
MAKTFTKLTRAALRKLATGEKVQEHGICFERLPNGDGVFTINIMVDGQRIHRTVGQESDGTTRTQAEEYIARLRHDAKLGRLSLPKGRKTALSFAGAAQKYLERLQTEGGRDMTKKAQHLARQLVPFFGLTPLSAITTSEVERYKATRVQAPHLRQYGQGAPTKTTSAATVNRELAVLSHLLNRALEWGWIDRVTAKIKRLKEDKGRITYLTPEQCARLVDAARGDQNPHIYPFIVMGLGTSMRRMEILATRRADIHLDRRTIFIPRAKAGAREQPITPQLATFLRGYEEALPPGTPWLFPSPGAEGGHAVNIQKAFARVVGAAGLDPRTITPHTLRHTAITHLVQAGVDLPTVKRISGHKTLAMVERYAHANGAHIQTAMERLEGRIAIPPAVNAPGTITQELHKSRASGQSGTA